MECVPTKTLLGGENGTCQLDWRPRGSSWAEKHLVHGRHQSNSCGPMRAKNLTPVREKRARPGYSRAMTLTCRQAPRVREYISCRCRAKNLTPVREKGLEWAGPHRVVRWPLKAESIVGKQPGSTRHARARRRHHYMYRGAGGNVPLAVVRRVEDGFPAQYCTVVRVSAAAKPYIGFRAWWAQSIPLSRPGRQTPLHIRRCAWQRQAHSQ